MPRKVSKAKELGLRSLRYEFGLYPTSEQAVTLLDQSAMCRVLKNALTAIIENRYLRKIGDEKAITPYLLHPGAIDDPDAHDFPSSSEIDRWITGLLAADPRWRALSTHTPRRVGDAVERSWKQYFRNLKNSPEMAGRPRRKRFDDVWIPHIHNKPAGGIGSAGSGCRLDHIAGRNWTLTIKGVSGPIHVRGQMPDDSIYATIDLGRFVDADIKLVGGKWKLSICAHVKRERASGATDTYVEFDLIDTFVKVNGAPVVIPELIRAQEMQDRADALQAERDLRWPKRTPADPEWREANDAANRARSAAARVRRDALHVWTTRLVAGSSGITIVAPPVREKTKTPRGNERQWGAAVETVSKLNRHVLSQAPGMAIAMIKYKAEEAEIRCDVVKDEAPKIDIGEKLVAAVKHTRKLKRAIRKAA